MFCPNEAARKLDSEILARAKAQYDKTEKKAQFKSSVEKWRVRADGKGVHISFVVSWCRVASFVCTFARQGTWRSQGRFER